MQSGKLHGKRMKCFFSRSGGRKKSDGYLLARFRKKPICKHVQVILDDILFLMFCIEWSNENMFDF